MNKGKKVFVGLSGGVDSAVSAALLKEQGYDVTGVFIKVWQPDFLTCTWREERRDAMRVASKLEIPFLFFDFSEEYKKGVADYMIEEYKNGRTPNPDVMCNREVKFGAFWNKAKEMGADFIATGHYVRNEDGRLMEGVDSNKDQSYFLYTLTQEDLEHILFPIGHLKKDEVRRLAKKFGLSNADKADSQGICFLGDVDLETFLSNFIKVERGDVLSVDGEVIGKHKGALYYTLGERHGFEIFKKGVVSKPFYVVSKDMKANTIIVSNKEKEIEDFKKKDIVVTKINWINKLKSNDLEARVRYRQERLQIKLENSRVIFKNPQTVASGQAIVFYHADECLGGGIIEK